MNVGKSVRYSLDALDSGDLEHAMLHACNALDGTAKKVYPTKGVADRFKTYFRDKTHVMEPFAIPWLDLRNTKLQVRLDDDGPRTVEDFATIVYTMHRCFHGHGDEPPAGWTLQPADILKGVGLIYKTSDTACRSRRP